MQAQQDNLFPEGYHKMDLPASYNCVSTFLDRHIREGRGENIAIRCGEETVTYAKTQEMVNRAGNGLAELGVERGDRVYLLLPDSPSLVYAMLGAMKIAAVPIPVNTRLPDDSHAYMLNDSRAKVMLVDESLLPLLERIKPRLKFLKHVVVDGSSDSGYQSLADLLSSAGPELEAAETHKDETAFWLYTSGSTGEPKGVVHQHQNWIYCCECYARPILGIRETDVCLSVSKLFHAYGLGNGLFFPFYVGASAALFPDVPRPEPFLAAAEKHRVTLFFGVPTFYAAALSMPDLDRKYDLTSIRLCVSAGEPLPKVIFERWLDKFGVEILDGIGSTEVLHIYISPRQGMVRPGSTGWPCPGYDVKIVDSEGQELGRDELGILWVRGQSTTTGFWNKKDKTRKQCLGEWFNTEDLWYVDRDGYYWYSGRADDAFKSRGEWVMPVEVENTIIKHEEVLESAVIGTKDENGLERPMAFVVLQPGGEPSDELAERIKAHIREELPGYKVPAWIRFVDELPKTATGKFQRFKLRLDVREERARSEL
jgi:benzoate-CoA ligase